MLADLRLDKNRQQQGSVAANELPKYGVTRDTKVWKQGMSDWQTAGTIPELSGIVPPPIMPPSTPSPPSSTPPPIVTLPYQTVNTKQPQKPDNLLVWSILATVLCCIPSGVVAIIQSNRVNSCWEAKDYAGAQEAANNAKTWCYVSLGLGIVAFIIAFFVGLSCFKKSNF